MSESIPPPERENPEQPLSTEELTKQLGEYANKLTEQRQSPPTPPGAEDDSSSSEAQ